MTRALLDSVRDGIDDRDLAAQICQACVDGLDVDGAAISLLTASVARETLWATDPIAELLEDLQFTLNEGACMQAATTGNPVLVPDLRHGSEAARWPIFAAAVPSRPRSGRCSRCRCSGARSTSGCWICTGQSPGGLSDVQWRDALAAADTAALMMLGQRTDPGDDSGELAGSGAGPPRRDPPGHRHGPGPARDQRHRRPGPPARPRVRAPAAAHRRRPRRRRPTAGVHPGHDAKPMRSPERRSRREPARS